MKAVIFAAGLGTRLRPLTDEIPKPMIRIGGRPILEHTLEALPTSVSEVIMVIGYKGKAIREYFNDAPAVRFVEQHELRGTYDALSCAQPFLDGPFLALNGDDLYSRKDMEQLIASGPYTMLAHRLPTANPYSHLEVLDGQLRHIALNKDSMHLPERLVYVGACHLDGSFFHLEPASTPNGESGLPQTLERHLATHPVRVIEASYWMPIGTPDELQAARLAVGS
jgi:NDP-sugar pyrophosphorylase family protein